jgi:transcriptional regulator with XRE-family HTH domain
VIAGELGTWLRQEREARSWTRAEMARRLIKSARASGDTAMPSADNISHNIYRWERGVITPGERYKLYYCRALGISSSDFGTTAGQPEKEKARRWDHLVELLKSQSLQDTHVLHSSNLRRATLMLLASREELPGALVAELRAYQIRLDALYLEAKDGFQDTEGILNAISAHVIGSLVGELSQPDLSGGAGGHG